MAKLIIDQLEETMITRLVELAAANRLSVEELAKELLIEAMRMVDKRDERLKIADRIAAMTPKNVVQTDSAILVREDRDR